MTKDEALKLALVIEEFDKNGSGLPLELLRAIDATLAQPVVFYRCNGCDYAREDCPPTICGCMEGTGFERVEYFTTPPQRPWVGLTNSEIDSHFEDHGWSTSENYYPVIKDINNKLKDKNT